ncbi:uncharacterized protein LOC124691622 [Lolium rigidum]|uniref:uncharacterized protein LOC124691622 n=1 Tax=Lolium rigidum TaxID=89674 RepID=UPI001F5DDA9D|nr:uncharacterized protein LOC124691622 [Lolium rigidum]
MPPDVGFSILPGAHFHSKILGCRHGLMLVLQQKLKQVLVWDPVAGDQHRLAVPPGFDTSIIPIQGTVLRRAGDAYHFQVVLEGSDKQQVFACIYSSETGVWSDLISTLLPYEDFMYMPLMGRTSVLVGDSVYWMFAGTPRAILELDLGRQSLALIHLPVEIALCKTWNFMVMPAEGGGLGLLFLTGFTAQLWKMNTDCHGVASWGLGRTVKLDKLLSLNSEEQREFPAIAGLAECNNVVFLSTDMGLFMVQLESLQFKKCSESRAAFFYHPFETVYAAGI